MIEELWSRLSQSRAGQVAADVMAQAVPRLNEAVATVRQNLNPTPALPPTGEQFRGRVDRVAGKFAQTTPARMVQSAIDGVMAPGRAMRGEFGPPGSREFVENAVGPAFDLAGLVTGGSFMAPAQRNAVGMGIRAYHGSPHDFDKFNLSKIGTGEGAQAYGHGLYFAENEGVARTYRDALAAKTAPKSNSAVDLQELYQFLPSEPKTMEEAQMDARRLIGMGALRQKDESAFLELWRQNIDAAEKGRMYEVNINAHPDQFLDWDKPLSQQSEHVKQAISPYFDKYYEGIKPSYSAEAQEAWKSITHEPMVLPSQNDIQDRMLGSEALRSLFGGKNPKVGDRENAAEVLRQAGIPGIRYLDQGSRAAGDGSRNYVVFDDSLVEILRKYGLAGLGVLPAAAQSVSDQSQ